MAELKTQKNDGDVEAFLASVDNARRRRDAETMCAIMTELSGEAPAMWGDSIVGFGEYPYTSGSGKGATWMKTGFSPRKQALTVYIMDGVESHGALLEQLGPHSTGRACLYVRDLEKVDRDVLEQIISASLAHIGERDERT